MGVSVQSSATGTISLFAGTGTVSLFAGTGTVSLFAGTVPLLEMVVFVVQFVNGMVSLVAGTGTVSLFAGTGTVSLVAGMVVLFVLLVEGMVLLAVVLQGIRYTEIVNMISEYLWVWFVAVMLEEVLFTAGLEAFCIVLLEEVTLALLQLVPLMVSLVVPSGAGTVLFEVPVVMFTNVVFSVVVVVSLE
jgi:hypothetical protein